MEDNGMTTGLDYNTGREKLAMPEYGRNVLKMIEQLRDIQDKEKRSAQARAIVKVMEILNPQVRTQENYEHKLWDHLFMIAGYDIDIDSPYPLPEEEVFSTRPMTIPMKDTPIKASHYGRNIERIIDLLCAEPDGEVKTEMIRCLAIYMRQQYLIWNKDNVADQTIFKDIEKLAGGRITIPEGLKLSEISANANFSRPSIGNIQGFQPGAGHNRNNRKKNKGKKK